jgi:hypothetical protein
MLLVIVVVVCNGKYTTISKSPTPILTSQILTQSPERRLPLQQALRHPFLTASGLSSSSIGGADEGEDEDNAADKIEVLHQLCNLLRENNKSKGRFFMQVFCVCEREKEKETEVSWLMMHSANPHYGHSFI